MSVGELVDGAFQVLKRRFVPLAKITALVVIPTQVLSILINISARPTTEQITTRFGDQTFTVNRTVSDTKVVIAGILVVFILGLVAQAVSSGAMAYIVGGDYLGSEIDAREALATALKRLPGIIGAGLLVAIGSGLGLLACIVPGVFLYVAWSVATPALMIERASATKAMSRSMNLVSERWWPTFGFLILLWLMTTIPTMLISIPVGLAFETNSIAQLVVSGLVSTAVALVVTPFTSAATVLLYFDLRVRNEGLDLQMLAQAVGATPPAPTQPASGFGTSDAQPGSWGTPPPPVPPAWGSRDDVPPPPPAPPA